jgi:hypothetical protein
MLPVKENFDFRISNGFYESTAGNIFSAPAMKNL